jgi:CubicO group peptidase (beta-lactamase class C family)
VIAFVNDGRIDGKQVLSPSVIRALSTPRAKIPGGNASYGYGLQISSERGFDTVSHGGSRAGYGSSIRMVPSKKFGVIALANRTGIGLTTTVEMAMQIGLASLRPRETSTAAPPAAVRDMNVYVGTYSQGPRTVELMVQDGQLMFKQNDRRQAVTVSGNSLLVGSGRWIVVRGESGAIEYLHAGGRSWRKVN